MNNNNWSYDQDSGRYIIKGARILYPNFAGEEQDYNQAGKRNFRLVVDETLAHELEGQGIHVRARPPRDETEEATYLIKVGVYPSSDIRILSGKAMRQLDVDEFDLVDDEYRKGHVDNGRIGLEFHISRNTKVQSSSLYVRTDTMVVPITKSKLLEDYDDYDSDDPFDE